MATFVKEDNMATRVYYNQGNAGRNFSKLTIRRIKSYSDGTLLDIDLRKDDGTVVNIRLNQFQVNDLARQFLKLSKPDTYPVEVEGDDLFSSE